MIATTQTRVALPTGVTLTVYQAGHGPDILLLHGTTGSGLYWSVQIDQLVAAGYRVTAPDGRGHGTSDRASDYSTAAIVADACALIGVLQLHKPIVIGHSMGGVQALNMAVHYPDLVACAILEDPALVLDPRDDAYVDSLRASWRNDLATWLPMSYAELVSFKRRDTPHWSDEAIRQWAYTKMQNDFNVLQWLDELKLPIRDWITPTTVPVHLLYCEPNTGGVVQPELITVLQQLIPLFSAEIIPHAGHYMRLDQPEAFFNAVMSFLQSQNLLP